MPHDIQAVNCLCNESCFIVVVFLTRPWYLRLKSPGICIGEECVCSRGACLNVNICGICVCLLHSDNEKGKRMWNKYLEREDSKVVGKCLSDWEQVCILQVWFSLCVIVYLFLCIDLFVGQLKSSLTCSECGYCSTVFDPFWDLSLPIAKVSVHTHMHTHMQAHTHSEKAVPNWGCLRPQKGSGEVSLTDCMRLFTKEDVLDGDEKPVRCYWCVSVSVCYLSFWY